MQEKSIALRFKNGGSDKAYNVSLERAGDGWVVNTSHGKYGGTLKAGTKTQAPVDFDKAQKIYDKTVGAKTSKGYSPEGDGVAFSGTELAGRVTGYQPQLLNDVTEEEIIALVMANPGGWYAEEKHDGDRRGLKVSGGEIVPSNRKGLQVPVRGETEAAVAKLAEMGLKEFEIDCEIIGPKLVVFDLLMLDGEDLRALPFEKRLEKRHMLATMFTTADVEKALTVTAAWQLSDAAMVRQFIKLNREKNAEGVVFKKAKAPYTPGRPNSGGDQLKLKFYKDATVRVASHNDKRSVAMEVLDGDTWVGVGNVTISPSMTVPPVGGLIDVKYLYAHRGGALFQPQYLRDRFDLDESDCTIDKLHYKAEVA